MILSGRDGDDPRRLAETEKASPSSATRPSSREFLEKNNNKFNLQLLAI